MMTKKTMTTKQTNKLLLQQLKGTRHENQKPDIMGLSLNYLPSLFKVLAIFFVTL